MTKFRWHRGSLADSMKTVVEFEGLFSLIEILNTVFDPGKVVVKPYGFDARIGWNTHLVTIDGNAVGMTDGQVE